MQISEGRNWWHLLFSSKEEAQTVKDILDELIQEKTQKKKQKKG